MLETRDYRFINFPIAQFIFFNALVWVIYGYLINDYFIMVSQIVSGVSASIQIIFYLWAARMLDESHIVIKFLSCQIRRF